MKVEDFEGNITSREEKLDKNQKPFFKFEIDGNVYNWFTAKDPQGEELANGLKVGDKVKGVVELNDGDYNGKPITFRNIKEMHKVGEVTKEEAHSIQKVEYNREMTNRQAKSMALSYSKDIAIAQTQTNSIEIDIDEIIETANKFYEFIKEE